MLPLIILASLAAQDTVPLDQSGRVGEISVKVVDQFGQDVLESSVKLTSDRAGANDTRQSRSWLPGEKIPYGTYYLEVVANGYLPHHSEVSISSHSRVIIACVRFVGIGTRKISVRVLRPSDRAKCADLILVPLFCDCGERWAFRFLDDKILISDLPTGDYAAVLTDNGNACSTRRIRVSAEPGQAIQLHAND